MSNPNVVTASQRSPAAAIAKRVDTGSSWVLIRVSNTEDGVRVSAEAHSMKEAEQLARSYALKVKRAGA